jgi:hypothetical protein
MVPGCPAGNVFNIRPETRAMSDPFTIALFAFGISVLASAVRMVDWFIHSDPKTIARAARWAVTAIAALSIPLLLVLLLKEQWTAAIALAAAMILVAALLGRRMMRWVNIRPLVADTSGAGTASFHGGRDESSGEDPELVRRAAAVLEAYLRRTDGRAGAANGHLPAISGRAGANGGANGHAKKPELAAMLEEEALAILDLQPSPTASAIREAHHRIAQKIHPDGGGSHYLAAKVNQAREVLLQDAGDAPLRVSSNALRKRKSSRRRPHQHPEA